MRSWLLPCGGFYKVDGEAELHEHFEKSSQVWAKVSQRQGKLAVQSGVDGRC